MVNILNCMFTILKKKTKKKNTKQKTAPQGTTVEGLLLRWFHHRILSIGLIIHIGSAQTSEMSCYHEMKPNETVRPRGRESNP